MTIRGPSPRVQDGAEHHQLVVSRRYCRAWGEAVAFGVLMGLVSFGSFYHPDDGFWSPYSDEALAEHLDANQTVLIDFTADW